MAPRPILLMILLLSLLVGCLPQPASPPLQSTAVLHPVFTSTAAPPASPTLQPLTSTSTSSPTTSQPPADIPIEPPTPDFQATEAAITALLVANVQPQTMATYPSPDGKWQAELITYPCTKISNEEGAEAAYDQLRVIRLQDQISFPAADQLKFCGGVGAAGLGGIRWSPNSRFFYYTTVREGVPDGIGGVGWNQPLYRYDTSNNQVEFLGGSAFSPDGNLFAAVRGIEGRGCLPDGLQVRDFDGQVIVDLPIPVPDGYCWNGHFTWSSDSQQLALIETFCTIGVPCTSNVSIVTISDGKQQVLIQEHKPAFQEVSWTTPDQLLLIDESYKTWIFTIATGELKQ